VKHKTYESRGCCDSPDTIKDMAAIKALNSCRLPWTQIMREVVESIVFWKHHAFQSPKIPLRRLIMDLGWTGKL
jgi:hypothetical protein